MVYFTVEKQEASLILQALAEQPARISMNLIIKLQGQLPANQPNQGASAMANQDIKKEPVQVS